MPALERTTYFGYNEGIDPDLLQIGSLVFDYANPRTRDLLGDPPLATADHRPVCSMGQSNGNTNSFNFGLEGLLEFGNSKTEARSRLVVGQKGSKVELRESVAHPPKSKRRPFAHSDSAENYLTSHILKNDDARLWLETRLSVAGAVQKALKNAFRSPKIWMLTGVYYMEDATVYHLRSKISHTTASGKVPIPEPTGMTGLLNVKVGGMVRFGKNMEGEAEAQILGKKVWAAQWTLIQAKYFHTKRGRQEAEVSMSQLKLLDVWSVGTERGADEQVAELKMADGQADADGLLEYDEGEWRVFDDKLTTLLEDLE